MTPVQVKWLRIGALALFFLLAWLLGLQSGLADKLNKEDMQGIILGAGPWGAMLFVTLVCIGLFIQIPGIVFVAGAILIYGYWLGMLIIFAGGLIGISVSFAVAQGIAGDPLAHIKRPWAKRLLARLKDKPIQTMSILRVFMLMSPALNVTLALSGVRYRDYLLAGAIGMWVPVIVTGTTLHYFIGS